jgi:hypothetical protein
MTISIAAIARLTLVASFALGSFAEAQTPSALSAEERTIVRTVDAENARTLALLQRIVDINSGTMNFTGVRRVGDALRVELDSLGFTTRRGGTRCRGSDRLRGRSGRSTPGGNLSPR